MKGVLKGFKYISNIFDEEDQEDEIQIGLPTDVKHVAHIGMDGPSTESPSWMKDFSGERPKSAPLDSKGAPIDREEKTTTDTELTRTSRRRHSADSLVFDKDDRVAPAKAKGSRKKKISRRHKKDSSSDQEGGSKASEDLNSNGEPSPTSPTARKLPDIPKKSRRKKVKDEISKIATKAKPKASNSDGADVPSPAPLPRPPATKTTDNASGPGSEPGPEVTCDGESCRITLKPSPPGVGEEKS